VLHLIALALIVSMVLLGRWQLNVSNAKHFSLQNFGYALQWWAFSAFALILWIRIIRDARHPPPASTEDDRVALVPGQGQVDGVAFVGPADMVAWSGDPDEEPIVYRGYVPPQSATTPAHSEGDGFHASYNDYLWQLAMADDHKAGRITSPRPLAPEDTPELEGS
jgi:hypothetical protein